MYTILAFLSAKGLKLSIICLFDRIFLQELESLCEGLEGRSSNPVAVLFDALCHPDADLGADNPSVLEWKFEEEHAINHIVLGKLRPGGAWQVLIMIFSLKCLKYQ